MPHEVPLDVRQSPPEAPAQSTSELLDKWPRFFSYVIPLSTLLGDIDRFQPTCPVVLFKSLLHHCIYKYKEFLVWGQ
jgi:hypothetical protein